MPSKTNKFSFSSDYLVKYTHCRFLIFDMSSKKDRGATLMRYTFKMHTSQTLFHCQSASIGLTKRCTDQDFPRVTYLPNQLLGKNTIVHYFKLGAEKLGLLEPPKFRPHSLRAVFVQKLVNDPKVSVKESMIASRQKSVSAQLTYTASNHATEAGKLGALGFSVPSPFSRSLEL